jgi:phosphatidylglycerophosphate synthase
MLDTALRPLIDPPLNFIARYLAAFGISANGLTFANFIFSFVVFTLIGAGLYGVAFVAVIINRLIDGLDGPVARQHDVLQGREPTGTDFGGYLDIVTDFILYGGVVFAFAVADVERAQAAAFLLFSYMVSGSSFFAYAIVAAKKNITTEQQGKKSFYYLSGLAEGFETIVAMCLMCLLPQYFDYIAYGFGVLCIISGLSRMVMAYRTFS